MFLMFYSLRGHLTLQEYVTSHKIFIYRSMKLLKISLKDLLNLFHTQID